MAGITTTIDGIETTFIFRRAAFYSGFVGDAKGEEIEFEVFQNGESVRRHGINTALNTGLVQGCYRRLCEDLGIEPPAVVPTE